MRYLTLALLFGVLIFGFHPTASAQKDVPIHPSLIGKGVFLGITPPLRDLPALTAEEVAVLKEKALKRLKQSTLSKRLKEYL